MAYIISVCKRDSCIIDEMAKKNMLKYTEIVGLFCILCVRSSSDLDLISQDLLAGEKLVNAIIDLLCAQN